MPVFSADEPEQFYTAGYTVVAYTANYDLASALDNGEVLIQAIESSVFPALKDKEINGSAIDGDYLNNTALNQLQEGKLSFFRHLFCHFSKSCIIASIDP